MSVTKIVTYRVEVVIDDRAWELFHDSHDFNREWSAAITGNDQAGSNSYSEAVMWAEFSGWPAVATACDAKLKAFAAKWAQKAREYDAAGGLHNDD